MSNKILFSDYEGQTFEWLFFNEPGFVRWLEKKRIHRQSHFGDDECAHFSELWRRATNLGGTCCQCDQPVTRMGLTTHRNGRLAAVGFYCATCEYQGGSRTGHYPAALWVEDYTLNKAAQKMLLKEVQRHYMGGAKLTQEAMEEFFSNDKNFSHCLPGFFKAEVAR